MLFLLYLTIILASLFISIYNSKSTSTLAQKVQEKLTVKNSSILFSDISIRNTSSDEIRTEESDKEPLLPA